MNVQIRQSTADNSVLMDMLKRTATELLTTLHNNGINFDNNSVKIWIKEYNKKLFPKIEFDVQGEELQYDLTHDGAIREAHFKTFIHTNHGTKRKDLEKKNANPLLIRIDNILRYEQL